MMGYFLAQQKQQFRPDQAQVHQLRRPTCQGCTGNSSPAFQNQILPRLLSGEPASVPPSSSPPPKRWIWRAPSRPCANPLRRSSTTPSPPLATSPTPSPSAPSTSVTAAPHSRTLSQSVAWVLALLFYSLTDAPTSTFLRKLDLMTEAAAADLQHLETMTFGAVSFAELLGHCGEALKVYERQADAIETRLASFGYVPPGNSQGLKLVLFRPFGSVLTLSRAVTEPQVDVEEDAPEITCSGDSSSVLRSTRGRFDREDALYPSISFEFFYSSCFGLSLCHVGQRFPTALTTF
jgi:hypothetical protein